MTDTIFDKILRKEIPSDKVYEDDWVYAFRDIHPKAPVHVLVIPKKKLKSFAQVTSAESLDLGEYLKGVAKVAALLGLEKSGYRIVFNHGDDGGQTVDYIHAHILGGQSLGFSPL
jgi:histidine triad (HIT) family protein